MSTANFNVVLRIFFCLSFATAVGYFFGGTDAALAGALAAMGPMLVAQFTDRALWVLLSGLISSIFVSAFASGSITPGF